MHLEYVKFDLAVQGPSKGASTSNSYRVGDVAAGMADTHLHAIYEEGDWIALVDKRGEVRMSPRSNVVDAKPETAATKAYRLEEKKKLDARKAAAQKEDAA